MNGAELTSLIKHQNLLYIRYICRISTDDDTCDRGRPRVFWTFDLVPALDGEAVYFVKEDYADVTNPEVGSRYRICCYNERR